MQVQSQDGTRVISFRAQALTTPCRALDQSRLHGRLETWLGLWGSRAGGVTLGGGEERN